MKRRRKNKNNSVSHFPVYKDCPPTHHMTGPHNIPSLLHILFSLLVSLLLCQLKR